MNGYLKASIILAKRKWNQLSMYEDQDCYDKAVQLFGTRVGMICAMELAKKIDAETAYENIKIELKELKRVRKKWKKDDCEGC